MTEEGERTLSQRQKICGTFGNGLQKAYTEAVKQKERPKRNSQAFVLIGRGDRIRTYDILLPKQGKQRFLWFRTIRRSTDDPPLSIENPVI